MRAFLVAGGGSGFAEAGRSLAQRRSEPPNSFYRKLVAANDARIPSLITAVQKSSPRRSAIRGVAGDLQGLAAAFCAPESSLFRADALIPAMEAAARLLLEAQQRDGTIDSGNLESPPDTAFVVDAVSTALAVLRKSDSASLQATRGTLERFLLAAAEPLVTGGVHTPNHRWVVCAALAGLNALFPSAKFVNRIDDWLGEGIDIDADGQYCERSIGIYSQVSDAAFLKMARLLARPVLLEPVRRNLEMTLFYMHPDGELETVGSRRQDQFMTRSIGAYYREYRGLAIVDRNPRFADVVRSIEARDGAERELVGSLIHFLEDPRSAQEPPASAPLPADYARLFPNSSLARIRRGDVSATVYGGSDWPLGVASGLASNPTFFSFRKRKAVLESVRMGAAFFSKGHFRSAGLTSRGNRYFLQQRLEVPYYQPLLSSDRNPQGDYPLTPAEDRFWSKMNFSKRGMSNVKVLEQKVTVTEKAGVFELEFDVAGLDGVPVAVELSFRRGGTLEGVRQANPGVFFLGADVGRYRVGDDGIEFGPGRAEHERTGMEGASYSAHGGTLKTGGDCVYITGFTPFREKLTIG